MNTLLVFLLILTAIVLLIVIVKKVRLRNYCSDHEGKVFLVLDKRHGWLQFYQNNIRNVIPSKVSVLWLDSECEGKEHRAMLPSSSNSLKAPYFAFIGSSTIRIQSLNRELLELKKVQRSSDDIQKSISDIFRAVLADGQEKL